MNLDKLIANILSKLFFEKKKQDTKNKCRQQYNAKKTNVNYKARENAASNLYESLGINYLP